MLETACRQLQGWIDHAPESEPSPELLTALDAIVQAADDAQQPGPGLAALFGGLVEYCNDQLSAVTRQAYGRLFARVIWTCAERHADLHAELITAGLASEQAIHSRWLRLRRQGPAPAQASRIAVLSRVTIGADVLLTSTLLQHLHRAYPQAELLVLGDGKLQGLLGGLPQVRVLPLRYARRGPLSERLGSWLSLRQQIRDSGADLVVSPDSRLDQLGLLPVIDDERYLLWENLQPATGPAQSLADLLDAWCQGLWPAGARSCTPRLGFDAATQRQAALLQAALGARPLAAVKLDHGGNAAKSLPRDAEVLLLRRLRERGWRLLIDRGFGTEECANSDTLLQAAELAPVDIDDSGASMGLGCADLIPGQLAEASVVRFHGSIAGWAAGVRACQLALSYDSVGQHLAAALAVPVVVPFTGYASDSFPIAWQPRGPASTEVIRIPTREREQPAAWARVMAALPDASAAAGHS